MVSRQYFYPWVVIESYHTMTSKREQHPTALHFSIDGCEGILRAYDIIATFNLPVALANSADYRQWPHPSPREMVRLLSRDTSTGTILFRRQLPTGMLFIDHVLRCNLFPLQHWVERRGTILEALYLISEGFWFNLAELIMTSLFQFEEIVHRKSLSRAEAIPLLFPRFLSQVLENLEFLAEPCLERRQVSVIIFTVDKWKFLSRALSLPLEEPLEERLHLVEDQQQPDPTEDPQTLVSSLLVASEARPASSKPPPVPPVPLVSARLNTLAPPMESIPITPRDFVAVMIAVHTFEATSAFYANAHAALAEWISRTETILTRHTAILLQI